MSNFLKRSILLFGVSFLFLFLSLLTPSSSFAQQCITVPFQPNLDTPSVNVCSTVPGMPGYSGNMFNEYCSQPVLGCLLLDSCTKYTGTECCTINAGDGGQGGLHRDYCQQISVEPGAGRYWYTIQCCLNPTPTPTPTNTPTPTLTPPPTPTLTPSPTPTP